jgi:NADPH:quinone reductase
VFGDGPVTGATVLAHGVLGGVGSLAAQLARCGAATVIGTVRTSDDLIDVDTGVVDHVVPLDRADPAADMRAVAPAGVDRIIEVAFSDNVDLDAAVSKIGTVVAGYASRQDRPTFPFWPMLFNNMTIRLLGSDVFPSEAKEQAATDVTAAARDGALSITVGQTFPLGNIADAHDLVDAGSRHRVVVALPD